MDDIVIEIRGGVLAQVYTSIPSARVLCVDWDNADSRETGGAAGLVQHAQLQELPEETRVQLSTLSR